MITARRRTAHFISITQSALILASRHTRENLPREVGGVLVGWREGRRVVVVQDLLLVPNRHAADNRYDRENEPANALLQEQLHRAADSRLGYVGEWHSHPAPQPPSPMDVKTIRTIARDLRAPVALVVLMAHRHGQSVEPAGRIAERAAAGRTRIYDARIGTH